jgi:ABC-type glucose/galactose transport system permease subunit
MGILVTQFEVPLLVSFLVAMAVATLLGMIVALPAIRLRTDYLAIVTVTIGEIFRLVLKSGPGVTEYTRGSRGIRGFSNEFFFFRENLGLGGLTPDQYLLILVWIMVAVIGVLLWVLLKSPWGRVLKGIREDEDAVRALGKNVTAYKMQSFALGAAIAGLAGVFFAMDIGGGLRDLLVHLQRHALHPAGVPIRGGGSVPPPDRGRSPDHGYHYLPSAGYPGEQGGDGAQSLRTEQVRYSSPTACARASTASWRWTGRRWR